MSRTNVLVVLASVVAIGGVVWWNWTIFSEIGVSMPASGWFALILGAVLTLAVGGVLMFLIFYSSRRGYDDAVGRRDDDDRPAGG